MSYNVKYSLGVSLYLILYDFEIKKEDTGLNKNTLKKYYPFIIILTITFIITVGLFLTNNLLLTTNNSTLKKELNNKETVCILPNSSTINESGQYCYHYSCPTNYNPDNVLLLYDPYYYDFSYENGKTAYSFQPGDSFTFFHVINLPKDSYNKDTHTYEFDLQFESSNQTGIYLTSRQNAASIIQFKNILQYILIGFSLFACFSIAVLFSGKRDQKYLFFFLLYSLIFLAYASVSTSNFSKNSIVSRTVYNSFVFYIVPIIIFKVYTLKNISQVQETSSVTMLLRILFHPAFFFTLLIVSFCFQNDIFSLFISFVYSILGIARLFYFFRHKRNNSIGLLALTIGYIISFSLFILNAFYLLDIISISLPLAILISACYLEFPFLLGCFIYVLCQYSHVFAELEKTYAQLQDTNKHLDKLVDERTKELQDEQEKKHNLIMNIFHDLRTPVFIIREYTSLIKVQLTPEQEHLKKEVMEPLQHRITFLSDFIEDIFLITKLENDSLIMAEDHVDASKLLQDIASDCQIDCENKELSFHSDIHADCILWGDEMRLTQAIQNLTTNAVHYSKKGGSVSLSAIVEENQLIITVGDTGIGISSYDLPNIFQRYFRADRGRNGNNDSSSTGLGLSIAHEIIKKHKGTIQVESKQGKGTIFTVTLPCIPNTTISH